MKPVGQTCGLGREVGVIASQDTELDGGLLVRADPTQGMGKSACGVGNNVGVAGIGLGFTGIQICDPSHRQSRQISDRDPSCTSTAITNAPIDQLRD